MHNFSVSRDTQLRLIAALKLQSEGRGVSCSLRTNNSGKTIYDNSIVAQYLSSYGQVFTAAPRPATVAKDPDGQCYRNASLLVINDPWLSYAEGYARFAGLTFPHAWAVTPDGIVVDSTLERPENATYFGVVYDTLEYLRHLERSQIYGVLGSTPEFALRIASTGGIKLRAFGGPGSGNFGHEGRPGQVGGSATSSHDIEKVHYRKEFQAGREIDYTKDKENPAEIRPHTVTIYHQSAEEFAEGKPDFDAYFGSEAFLKDFPEEFGRRTYALTLPKHTAILDLNKDTPIAREFMAQMAERAYPKDTEFAEQLRQGKGTEDFYEVWTDKKFALDVLKGVPAWKGIKYQSEYILPKETIRKLVGERMRATEFNPDQPRDERGQWTSSGGPSTPLPPKFPVPRDEFDQMLKEVGFLSGQEGLFFHGTVSQAINSIKKNGLVPKGGKGADTWAIEKGRTGGMGVPPASMFARDPAVFLTENPYSAWRFANYAKEVNPGSDAVVLQITVPLEEAAKFDVDEHMSNAWRSLDKIPPAWIKGQLTESGELKALAKGITFYAVVLIKDESTRSLGGPGSGNFGHAGRPGEVGGSAPSHNAEPTFSGGEDADNLKLALARHAPESLIESTAKQIAVVSDAQSAEKIDEYLMKHYGFDLKGQAESMVDRGRGEVIATKQTAGAAFARTLESRFQSEEWKNAARHIGVDSEDAFTSVFNLFSQGAPLYEIAKLPSHLNLGNIALEKMYEVFREWGWL